MQQVNNWDSYRRKQVNINKAINNYSVSELLAKHYRYLYGRLVIKEVDRDIFNDIYLKLTYNYNPDKDFINQFIYYFNLLKGAYYRDDKTIKWLVTYIEDNPVEIPDNTESEPVKKSMTDNSFLEELKSALS